MKLSKKLMLFEEFNTATVDVKATSAAPNVSATTSNVNVDRTSVRTGIVKDVDFIINSLEDLANNLNNPEETNESTVNEGFVETILSAELYMIPVIAAGVVGTAAIGAGVGVGVLIKNIVMKKKIKSKYNKTVLKNRMDAAKMELYIKDLRDYKKQDFDEKAKKKIEEFKKKVEELKESADNMYDALVQKYEKYTDFISSLNSQTRMEIAELMLGSKNLTDSEKERYKKTYDNAVRALNNRLKKAEEDKKKAEEAAKNASEAERKQIEAQREKIASQIEEEENEEEQPGRAEPELTQVGAEQRN